MRIQREPHLTEEKGQQGHPEREQAEKPIACGEAAQPPLGSRPQQRHRDDRVAPQPDVVGRFLIGQKQPNERDGRTGPPSDPAHRHGNDQHPEHCPKSPLRDPGAGGLVSAQHRQEPMPRRQIELAADLEEPRLPSGCRQSASRDRQARRGLNVEVRRADFDAGALPIGVPRDEQRPVVCLLSARELEGGQHLQAPVAAQGPGDPIDHGPPATAEVEPQPAIQPQAVVVCVDQSSRALDNRQHRVGSHAESGVFPPVIRDARHLRVDGFGTLGGGDTEPIVARKAPDFLRGPGAFHRRAPKLRCNRGTSGCQRDVPGAGANLNAQASIRLEPCGQLAFKIQGHKPVGQGRREKLLAAGSRNPQANQSDQRDGHIVAHEPVDLDLHPLRLIRAAPVAEPECTARAFRLGDPSAIDGQIHERGSRVDRELLGPRAEAQISRDDVLAAQETHLRGAVASDQLPNATVDPHVSRPVSRVAGHLYPGLGRHLPALRERAAVRIDRHRQALGPCTAKRIRVRRRGTR